MVDEGQESFIHVHGHPVQLTLWACNKAINGDLHLQFELPHDSSVVDEYSTFIFLRAGYSTHKRFVLGGEECAAPFSSKTVVAYWADGCSPVDKGEIGPSHWRRAGSQVYHGRIQSRLQ